MAVENFIDEITSLWDGISDGKGGQVRSYRVYEKNEFPESLSVFPCAITYTIEVRNNYSAGGPNVDLFRGLTEFHLFPNVSKSNLPELMRYMARIRNAAAGEITLNGKVSHFLLRTDVPSVQGPLRLQYGSEEPHLGLLVNWEVKEAVTGDF